jgi:hypothetical protein
MSILSFSRMKRPTKALSHTYKLVFHKCCYRLNNSHYTDRMVYRKSNQTMMSSSVLVTNLPFRSITHSLPFSVNYYIADYACFSSSLNSIRHTLTIHPFKLFTQSCLLYLAFHLLLGCFKVPLVL